MAESPKPKAKPKPKNKPDKDQSARFIETARQLEVDESSSAFSEVVIKILQSHRKK